MTAGRYSPGAVRRGYGWLGHTSGVTEVTILHPDYRPRDPAWNHEHGAWPITHYLSSTAALASLVARYAGTRLVCYGLNPRPSVLTHPDGRLRSAKEQDITRSQNLVLDVDLHEHPTPERHARLTAFLDGTNAYFASLGINPPVWANTGRGAHLLFAWPPLEVSAHPELRGQLSAFRDDFVAAHRHELSRIEARVDSTQDLRRMVRVYGTQNPKVGITSTFPYATRVPDERMRAYLLSLTPAATTRPLPSPGQPVLSDVLPDWFPALLASDRVLNNLWHNRGKPATADTSNSGYDYTIAAYLSFAGKTPEDIITILNLRPTGSAERSRKGTSYLLRTVHNARHRTTR